MCAAERSCQTGEHQCQQHTNTRSLQGYFSRTQTLIAVCLRMILSQISVKLHRPPTCCPTSSAPAGGNVKVFLGFFFLLYPADGNLSKQQSQRLDPDFFFPALAESHWRKKQSGAAEMSDGYGRSLRRIDSEMQGKAIHANS